MRQLIVLALGAASVVAGIALVCVPAAFVVGGLGACAYALLWDFDDAPDAQPKDGTS